MKLSIKSEKLAKSANRKIFQEKFDEPVFIYAKDTRHCIKLDVDSINDDGTITGDVLDVGNFSIVQFKSQIESFGYDESYLPIFISEFFMMELYLHRQKSRGDKMLGFCEYITPVSDEIEEVEPDGGGLIIDFFVDEED